MDGRTDDSWLGKTLGEGRYRIERLLGEGGMGAVYAARDLEAGADVAVKMMHGALAREERHFERFRREAEVAELLAHPHIVGARGSGIEDDGTVYLVMELLDGQSLSAYMRGRGTTLPVDEAVPVVRQIAAALIAAHEVGVVHRDLKPGNVMVLRGHDPLRVKVVDFGLARFISSETYQKLTMTGQVLGTPAYMAPEQAFASNVDQRADIYAVGAILHALLVGQPPYGRGTSQEVLTRLMLNERRTLLETRPELGGIVEVVERCLAPNPEDRYPTAEELDQELSAYAAAEESVVHWQRPKTMATLVLRPDPVLDAPKATRATVRSRPTPRLRASEPVAATPATSRETGQGVPGSMAGEPGARPPRLPLLILGALVVALGAGLASFFVLSAGDGGSSHIVEATAAPGDASPPVAVVPTAVDDIGSLVDAAPGSGPEEAQPAEPDTASALADEVLSGSRPPSGERAPGLESSSGEAPPASLIARVTVLESYEPVGRARDELLQGARRLIACAKEYERLPVRLPWSFEMHRYGAAGDTSYGSELPPMPVEMSRCARLLANNVGVYRRPTGAHSTRVRLELQSGEGPDDSTVIVDRTDWSSRRLTPSTLRATVRVTGTDIPFEVVRQAVVSRNAGFARCLEEAGPLVSPPPFRATLQWARFNDHLSVSYRPRGSQPHAVAGCARNQIGRRVTLPLPPGMNEVDAELTMVAAERTSIVVVDAR